MPLPIFSNPSPQPIADKFEQEAPYKTKIQANKIAIADLELLQASLDVDDLLLSEGTARLVASVDVVLLSLFAVNGDVSHGDDLWTSMHAVAAA